MPVRVHFLVEGQTEETFVKRVLTPDLALKGVYCYPRSVETSRRRGVPRRGGLLKYAHAQRDLQRWMKEQSQPDAYFTTMFDLYDLPDEFPGVMSATGSSEQRVEGIEKAFDRDIDHPRFIPYIQLHEFEALVLTGIERLRELFPEHERAVAALANTVAEYGSPEEVNEGETTAPSKRICRAIPNYDKQRAGYLVTEDVGLPTLRAKCPHFDQWLNKLEALGDV